MSIDRWLKSPFPSHWWHVGFIVLVAVLVDPFGVNAATSRYSQDVALRLLSPFYASIGDARRRKAPITVVLIDDQTIENSVDQRFPLRYTDSFDIIHAVMCGRPKAVFVDLLFRWRHDNTPHDFKRLVELLSPNDEGWYRNECGDKPPVYVADMLDQPAFRIGSQWDDSTGVIHSDLRDAGVQRLAVNWHGPSGTYPLWLRATETAGNWAPSQHDEGVASPALYLYAKYRGLDIAQLTGFGVDRSMTVAWGLFPATPPAGAESGYAERTTLPQMPLSCSARFAALWGLVVRGVSERLGERLDPSNVEALTRTFHTYHISAAPLVGNPFDGADREGLRRALEGRIVLIGNNFAGSGDQHQSPVHGTVPGVILHAMALDNLFRFDGRPWLEASPILDTDCPLPRWDTIATIALLVSLGFLHARAIREGWSLVRELSLAVVLTVGSAVILAFVFRWPPINWLGVLSLFLVVTTWWRMAHHEEREDRLS
jgi:CHASE2 domain-containing sensor protein